MSATAWKGMEDIIEGVVMRMDLGGEVTDASMQARRILGLAPELLQVFETAARYQMYHALGLLAVAWAASRQGAAGTRRAGWLFVAGTLLFSGSLYLMALTGVRWLGAITPLGGAAWIAGWAMLAASFRPVTPPPP